MGSTPERPQTHPTSLAISDPAICPGNSGAMRFFFPDSQDQVDPGFDFRTERTSEFRVRQRDDRYAHETLKHPAYDGLLVSKPIIDGLGGASGKYTNAQRHRLY